MRRGIGPLLAGLCLALLLSGCAAAPAEESAPTAVPAEETAATGRKEENRTQEQEETKVLNMMIGRETVTVDWEDNAAAAALRELCAEAPLTVQMRRYGGFEQVGPLGASLPRSDVQTTTRAGDIVLYGGDQIVVFYGSNSWAYTRLGHISDRSEEDMAALLGGGDVTVTLFL